ERLPVAPAVGALVQPRRGPEAAARVDDGTVSRRDRKRLDVPDPEIGESTELAPAPSAIRAPEEAAAACAGIRRLATDCDDVHPRTAGAKACAGPGAAPVGTADDPVPRSHGEDVARVALVKREPVDKLWRRGKQPPVAASVGALEEAEPGRARVDDLRSLRAG